MSRLKIQLLSIVAALLMPVSAWAQQNAVPDINFNLGDDIPTVKAALNTKVETEPMERNAALPAGARDINAGKTILHLRTRGIWVFFNPSGKAETIRLDAPYSKPVKGIKVGDPTSKITAINGQPNKKPYTTFITMQAYQYALDDSAYVTFDANDDGVQYIFITR